MAWKTNLLDEDTDTKAQNTNEQKEKWSDHYRQGMTDISFT